MKKALHESEVRSQIEQEYPRSLKDWLLDLVSIGMIIVWAYLPLNDLLKLFGFLLIIGYIISRYHNYKEWKETIDHLLDEKLERPRKTN